ncbi:MAG: glycosyltransferase, partial [Myxococcota bacterium]
ERAVRQARLVDRVHLLGWRRDIPQLLAAADVVALSSIFEGLPRSAVQAVAARRPFVGTRVDGTPEIIREGRDGYLVAPRDPSALAQALARALDLRPVAEDTEERVQAWDARRMVEAQEDLYERLLIR